MAAEDGVMFHDVAVATSATVGNELDAVLTEAHYIIPDDGVVAARKEDRPTASFVSSLAVVVDDLTVILFPHIDSNMAERYESIIANDIASVMHILFRTTEGDT